MKLFIYISFVSISALASQDFSFAQESEIREVDKFTLRKINFVGNTVFSTDELRKLIPISSEPITLDRMYYLSSLVKDYYISKGYRGSEAQLNVQQIADGEVYIVVLESTLQNIELKGLDYLDQDYILAQLPKVGDPLNLFDWYKAISRLEKQPAIKSINKIDLKRVGTRSNKRYLVSLEIEEESRLSSQYALTNGFSPSVGSLGGIASIGYLLSGQGDYLGLDYSRTEGLGSFAANYSRPLDANEGIVAFKYTRADALFIEDDISNLDIQADVNLYQLELSKSISNNQNTNFLLGIEFDFIDSESFLDGDLSFAFVDGLEDGKSQVRVLRFAQELKNQGENMTVLARSKFSLGLDIFNPTKTETGQDGLFWSWQGQLEMQRKIADLQLRTNFNIQLSPDRLLPVEQIAIGGINSIRGFKQNASIGDNGFEGTLELIYPFYQDGLSRISFIPFIDIGQVWNNNNISTFSGVLASTGAGISYEFSSKFKAQVDYGIPLVDENNQQNFSFLLFYQP